MTTDPRSFAAVTAPSGWTHAQFVITLRLRQDPRF